MDVDEPAGTESSPQPEIVRIRALDSVFRLEIAGAEGAERIRREWSRCVVTEAAPDEVAVPLEPGAHFGDRFTYMVASRITRLAIEAAAGRYVMFHAAAVTDEQGRALVLVGPSGTGKTTAAATLGTAGFGYLTDEAVAVTGDGAVLPYPKPLSIVKPGAGKEQRSPDELGLAVGATSPVLNALVLLDRVKVEDQDVEPRLEPIALIDALVELLPQTSALPLLDRPLQRLCQLIDRCGVVYRLVYSDIRCAQRPLKQLAGRDVRPAADWSPISRASEPWLGSSLLEPADALFRARCVDAVQAGGEGLLLRGSVPVRLSAVGLSIWRRLRCGARLADLVEATVRDHGPYPGAETVVREAVEAMIDGGVVTRASSAALA